MSALPIPSKIYRRGRSLGITLAARLMEELRWRAGDYVATRVTGDKIIIERIALEKAAIIRTGEATNYAANLPER